MALFVQGIFLFSLAPKAMGESYKEYHDLVENKQWALAVEKLLPGFLEEKDPKEKNKKAFLLGVAATQAEQWGVAKAYLSQALESGSLYIDYAHFLMGKVERALKNFGAAKFHFDRVLENSPSSNLKDDSQAEVAELLILQNQWVKAIALLTRMEKKTNDRDTLLNIYSNLLEANSKIKRDYKVCEVAQKMYGRFPKVIEERKWGLNLENLKVAGKKIECKPTLLDRERRFARYIQDGMFQRYKEELEIWEKRIEKKPISTSDRVEYATFTMLQGKLQMAQGDPNKAIELFTKSNEILGGNHTVLMNLARASSQLDDYYKTLEYYTKAYELNPKSSKGREALFQAGFTSYLFRDYDGATRRFEEFVRLSRDRELVPYAKWHLAWIRYLKKDYTGAAKAFRELEKVRYYASSPTNLEKITYWEAMSLLKAGETVAAHEAFDKLTKNKRMGYYALLATARLSLIDIGQEREAVSRRAASAESLGGAGKIPTDSKFKDRLTRAEQFREFGFDEWALNEFRDVEKKTRDPDDLEYLMQKYTELKSFNRSVLIADDRFRAEREKRGPMELTKLWQFAFPKAYEEFVSKWASDFGVSEYLVWSVMRAESSFKESIRSPAGALGLMQMIPLTAKKVAELLSADNFDPSTLLNPAVNIRFGARYLKRLEGQMENNLPLVIAAYNAGPHRVKVWVRDFGNLGFDEFIEHIPFLETRNYVKKVLRNYYIYQVLYEKHSPDLAGWIKNPTMTYAGPRPMVETWD